MGEAKLRAARRREAREAAATPTRAYVAFRQKVVDFLPDVYAAIEHERAAFNELHGANALSFDGYVNGLLVMACERERVIRERAAAEAKPEAKPEAVPADIADRVLAAHAAAG